jgi:lipopolysaccharide/colanic/teichoic acid biosynthesis glycosyltransferase
MKTRLVKRSFDIIASAVGLLLVSPVLVTAALAIRISMGSPVFYRQQRAGYQGTPFIILKLRTMSDVRDRNGNPLPDEERISRIGTFLRKTSVDELPELWNVLKGEMSLVGPRPLPVEYLPLYTAEQLRRHHVKPGITGWTAVNGRNLLGWEQRFAYDLEYVDRHSFWFDAKILLLTVFKVVKREGISQEGFATSERFHGNNVGDTAGEVNTTS